MKKNLKNKKGFTLIELIVVIAILGILAAIAIPRLSGVTSHSKKEADKASMKVLTDTAHVLLVQEDLEEDKDGKIESETIKTAVTKELKGQEYPEPESIKNSEFTITYEPGDSDVPNTGSFKAAITTTTTKK